MSHADESYLPQFPAAGEDDPVLDSIAVPTEVSFAEEVRADRLDLLWKITLFVSFVIAWALVVVSGGEDMSPFQVILPSGILAGSCLIAAHFLRQDRFERAVWTYALGMILAIGLVTSVETEFGTQYAPYLFLLVILIVGLLVSVRTLFVMLGLIYLAAFGFPNLLNDGITFSRTTFFAMVLTTIAAGLSAQVSGELYAIAEWALENYRRERRTSYALFDSREALQKSFLRQSALTQQLQDANAELEAARSAEEEAKNFRGQFLANMSHELRTPLNAIIGFSQTMLDFPAMYDGVDLPVQYRQDMNQILTSGKHLLTIINDILDLSKVDAGKLDLEIQPVDLKPIVKGVLSTAVGLVGDKGAQIKLLRDAPDPLPMVLGDPLRVRQVLLNLYSNAAKFTDSGYIKLIITVEGDEVIFGVEDTGIGIADGDKVTIFEEFRQGTAGRKKGRQGAGLGLPISQQLLRLMNGRMWFESVLGKGSLFCFALPLVVPDEDDTATDQMIVETAG
jgi:signal transduction histidine kinase